MAIALRDGGKATAIAEAFGVSRATVYKAAAALKDGRLEPARSPVRLLPDEIVTPHRERLAALPRPQLLELYAELPGRSPEVARRSMLSRAAMIDVILWTILAPTVRG